MDGHVAAMKLRQLPYIKRMFLGLSQSGGLDLLILTVHGYLDMGLEFIFCNLRTRRACPRKLRLIPRIIIFLSSVRAWGLWRRNSRRWSSSTSEPWWRKVASTLINCSSTTRMAS
ncbi:Lactoylglutathione lyase / glyoxalase I family protein [Prunus dulcis]|uniref:Lactoylglutathione lyase / glyoxalase I family protein n=1 Tax=Prunus dulcis TaxID=3755 RepID=A0A4Y1R4Z8_PRUDU|nr:Lactoylglutathione lyase / glyoxalase I family protein [Prunus dulcis]